MGSRKQQKAEPAAVLVGRRLAQARQQAGLSQTQLASDVRLTKGYVSMIERGERGPRLEVLLTWAARCGTTLSELLEGLEDEMCRQVAP